MANRSPAERARAVQEQSEKRDLQAQIQTLTAQIQAYTAQVNALEIRLGAAESEADRAVVHAVAQAEQLLNARHEQSRRQTLRQWRAESANSTQLVQAKDDTIYGLTRQLEIITAAKTALEARVEELENAAPAPADAVMDDSMMTCSVCVEDFSKNTMQNCNGRTNRTEANPEGDPAEHHVCSECFIGGVKTAMSDSNVNVKCLGGCQTPYTHEPIRKLLPEDDFAQWLALQTQREAGRIQDARDAYWLQRIETGIDPEEAQVENTARLICDDILTNKCGNPNCGQRWVDFDGCMAIQCAKWECRHYFCGWCMNFHHADYHTAHNHVRTCPRSYNPGSYFAPGGVEMDFMGGGDVATNMLWFKKAHINERRRRYNEVMRDIAPNLQRRIVAKCTTERLEEAGLIGDEGEKFAREALEELERIQNPPINL